MTSVHIHLYEGDGTTGATGYVLATPTTRRDLTAGGVALPVGFSAVLVDGEATMTLAPTGLTWCWEIREMTAAGTTRYISVVDSPTTVEYEDCADVDPTTLVAWSPADPEAAYTAALAAKVDEPDAEGTDGQALTTDGAGGRTWTTITGGVTSVDGQTGAVSLSSTYAAVSHEHTATDIDAGASLDGQVLTSDGAGNAAWKTPATGGLPELPAELLLTGKQYRLSGVSDAGTSASPSPDVIGVLITAQIVLIPIKSLVVTITTQASADAFVEIGIYDGATRSLVASFGQFNLNGSPGVRVLTLATAVTLPRITVFAAKLRSASANGGTFRAAYPPSPLHYAGDYWNGYGSPTRAMSAPHAGTGALPATLPSVSSSDASVPVMTAILG